MALINHLSVHRRHNRTGGANGKIEYEKRGELHASHDTPIGQGERDRWVPLAILRGGRVLKMMQKDTLEKQEHEREGNIFLLRIGTCKIFRSRCGGRGGC